MKYIVELPDEAVKTIRQLGYDINSYFDIFFVKPLLNEMKKKKIDRIIERKQVEIDMELKNVKDNISIEANLIVQAENIEKKPL